MVAVAAGDYVSLAETASVRPVTAWPYSADVQSSEFWSWQGIGGVDTSLHAPWWRVTTFGGSRFGLPALRGTNYQVPFRQGQVTRPKYPDSRVVTLVMSVDGSIDFNVPTVYGVDDVLSFNDNWDAIRTLFWTPGLSGSRQGKLTRRWRLTQAGTVQVVQAVASAEIAGTMDPAMTGRTRADFSVDLLLADPFFYGAQQAQGLYANTSAPFVNLGDDFVGFGQAQPFVIRLTGPLTSPTLTNSTWGCSFTLNQTLASAFYVDVDVLSFTVIGSDGISYAGNVTHTGARPWMALGPVSNTLALTTLAPTTDTGSARLTWSPPYL